MQILYSTDSTFPTPEAWDALVAADPLGHLLQTWAWGDLKGRFGWRPVRIAVARDGVLVAGAQVLYRPLGPLSTGYIPKGPVLLDRDDAGAADQLLQGIDRVSRRMRAISLKVEPEWRDASAENHAWLQTRGFQPSDITIQPRRTIAVDLTPADEDEVLARMKSKWRYNIRLSMRREVEVREGDVGQVEAFHQLMEVTGERDEFGVHSADYYRQAMALFAPQDRVRLLLAYYEGQLLAGIMVFSFNGQAWYMYGASSNEHRNLMPNHQLQWRAMQWAREKGCHTYDLWGITDRDDPDSEALSGVERFKRGFGGKAVRYVGAYDRVYIRPLYSLMLKLWERRRAQTAPGQDDSGQGANA